MIRAVLRQRRGAGAVIRLAQQHALRIHYRADHRDSARELCGTQDPIWLARALSAYFAG